MRNCLTQCKKRKKSLLFFLLSFSFQFSSDSITVQLQLQTKQCHFNAEQGVLVIYATDRYFRCLSLFHLSFSISRRFSYSLYLKTKGWQWKKVLWPFMALGCHGRGVSADTAGSLQPRWPSPMGKAQLLQHWERQECTSISHKWQEDS